MMTPNNKKGVHQDNKFFEKKRDGVGMSDNIRTKVVLLKLSGWGKSIEEGIPYGTLQKKKA